ncbi:MAG: ComEC family competence protein [Bradyrhizobiaceae bacterium]|nr:MAG: ComEC family competence protein [Bradyrhizobiaceae bacterium]
MAGPPVGAPPEPGVRETGHSEAGRVTAGTWPQGGVVPAGPGVSGGVFSPVLWAPALQRIQGWTLAESGPGRLLPWVPVAFGTGIALYFTADREPMAAVVAPVAALLCLAAFLMRRHRLFPAMVMLAALAAGFAAATLKTARIAHGVLARPVSSVALKGFVETHEERERTDRFVLRVESMDAVRGVSRLERVRLSVRKGTAPPVGSFVELKAKLQPPLAPLRPGSYDFGRDMYFQGIGASGFVLGTIRTLAPPRDGGISLAYAKAMQDMRDGIDARIRTVLGGDNRAIATALLTGRRDAIKTPVNDAMFISGLGHVLSISGYHMAVVAGVVFFAVRALLALSPALAAGYPIKKWSAAAALAAALFYLLLSGAEVATQRSFFMTAVVLLAIMVDRRAITFRTLAIAAMIVLIVAPEALVHPSFQMSFAATLGLVALVQGGMPKLFAAPDSSRATQAALWGGREIVALAAASFIAGLATTPYAAFHFHRITPYGVLANLAAMPVVSAIVMPAGLLGVAAIPFGFDSVFWKLMGVGIDWMIAVTQWVAALPGAVGRVASFGTGPLIAMTFGIILLGLLRTPLRWSGAGLIALGILWAVNTRQPDILVAGDGHNVAVRGKDGSLRLMHSAKDAFLLKEWLAGDADPRPATDPALGEGVSCDASGCVAAGVDGKLVALTQRPDALADDCVQASVMVSAYAPPEGCNALVIGEETLRRQGTLALRLTATGYTIEAVRPRGVDRPWSPAGAPEMANDAANKDSAVSASALRPRAAAPIDATPQESDAREEE